VAGYYVFSAAGWSSLVARRAHNPKVTGSNPVPATKESPGQDHNPARASLVLGPISTGSVINLSSRFWAAVACLSSDPCRRWRIDSISRRFAVGTPRSVDECAQRRVAVGSSVPALRVEFPMVNGLPVPLVPMTGR
jgi:hypothetical protein